MSLVTVNRAIVPAIWPNDLGRADRRKNDMQVRDSWRFVPDNFDALCDWAKVIDDESEDGRSRRLKHLVYRDEVLPKGGDGQTYTVTLVLQGFLGAHALGVLGNWKGKEQDAMYAMQFLTLESGGFEVPFAAQVQALENLRQLIVMHVGGDLGNNEGTNASILLKRPVFTKVRAVQGQPASIDLNDVNDPFGSARKMAAKWRVDHVVDTSVRRPNGTNMHVAADAIKRGDFVEVSVTARIQTVFTRKRRGTVVEFWMHDVVRLWAAKEAKIRATESFGNDPPLSSKTNAVASIPQVVRIGTTIGGLPGGCLRDDEGDVEMGQASGSALGGSG